MKPNFTLFLFLIIFSNSIFSQNNSNVLSDLDLFVLENTSSSNSKFQANLRNPYILDSVHTYSHLVADNDSTLERRAFHSYNSDNLLEEITDLYFSSDIWENDRKIEYEYDDNGNLVQYTIFSWLEFSSTWVNASRWSYTYDNNNNITELIRQFGGTAGLNNFLKFEYFYNNDGLRDSSRTYRWDTDLSEWSIDARRDYYYDIDNNFSEIINQNLDDSTQLFVNSTALIYEFNSNNDLASITYQYWNLDLLEWINNRKNEYVFDDMGNQIEVIAFNADSTAWTENVKIESSFDSFGNIIYYRLSSYNVFFDKFDVDESEVFFYSELQTFTQNPSSNLSINCQFENPISLNNIIKCQSENLNESFDFRLFDMAGKLIFQKEFDENLNTSLPASLNAGVYLLNISSEGKAVLNKKIVVVN